MEKYLLSIVMMIVMACEPAVTNDQHIQDQGRFVSDVHSLSPSVLFTLADAEKIIGEPAHLLDSMTTVLGDKVEYRSSYQANAKEDGTGKTGIIYFLYEQYNLLDSAKNRYSFIKKANEDHGIITLKDVGDEAYFHTDNENFYFIMGRKGFRVFTMKVNKITGKTSLDEFNRAGKKIAEAI